MVAILLAASPAHAQSYQCRAPSVLQSAAPAKKPSSEPRRIRPVNGYTLALSWSPEFCRLRKDSRRDKTQCSGDDGSFAFILHGLWPDARGPAYPQWCRATNALPPALIKRNFCMMPSTRLMASEWAKHGTCMAKRPETYFRISRTMFDAVQFPDMDRLSRKPLTVGALRNAFAAANDGLRPEMVRLKVNQRGWLNEVRLCLGKNFRPTRCPANMRALKDDVPVKIWRGLDCYPSIVRVPG
ncbi:ribonuclease T [Parasphingorhabdus halotolerans]|uniref:Ribonuclease T n=2 Tax=Parasphingorhabdus halotolerans TaxID=2725558 RepID=A0A6H2DQU8_9SPHN|nr:ribonuclease T [Parasphingorhabdus halotolerans]